MSAQNACRTAFRLLAVCVAFTLGTAFAPICRAAVEVLWPEATPEWGLLLNPGAQRKPSEYMQLAKRIQEESPVALAVGIAKFAGNWPEPLQMTGAAHQFKALVRERVGAHLPDEKFVLSGHSLAGIIMQELPAHEKFGGAVMLGSYPSHDVLQLGTGLRRAAIPTLVLAGEWDGLTRVTRVLDTVLECDRILAKRPTDKRCLLQRVVVLPGVNHSDFASGELQAGDFESELDLATAHTSIARAVGGFWNEVLLRQSASEDLASDRSFWRSHLEDTRVWAQAWDKVSQLDAQTCHMAQTKLLPQDSKGTTWEVAVKMVETAPGFVFAKPSIETLGHHHFRVRAVQTQDRPFNPLDLSIQSRSFTRLSCKLKSTEALLHRLQSSADRDSHRLNSCGSINAEMYQEVRSLLPAALTARLRRLGVTLRFGDDVHMSSGPRWIVAQPVRAVDTSARAAVVSLPRLQTSTNAPLQLDGMHYCQFVPPTQLAEWVFFDAFKVIAPSN